MFAIELKLSQNICNVCFIVHELSCWISCKVRVVLDNRIPQTNSRRVKWVLFRQYPSVLVALHLRNHLSHLVQASRDYRKSSMQSIKLIQTIFTIIESRTQYSRHQPLIMLAFSRKVWKGPKRFGMRISNGRGLCSHKLSLFIKFLECFINSLKSCAGVLLVSLLYFTGKSDFFRL